MPKLIEAAEPIWEQRVACSNHAAPTIPVYDTKGDGMYARIYKPARTAMQAGRAQTKAWVLEFDAETARRVDPLMGWTSADDMAAGQVRLTFPSRDEAVSYAEKHSIPYRVDPERAPVVRAKAYAENFSWRRRIPWTH